MTFQTRLRGIATAVLAISVATMACGHEPSEEVESQAAVSVRTVLATVGSIRGTVRATAIVSPAPGAELVVVAPEAARIAAIPKAVGDPVRRGELLVRFEIPTATAEVQRQRADVARAEATLANARSVRTRAGELFDRGVGARREVEDATRDVADAEAALQQARASSAAADAVSARATVRAAFDGIVSARLHNPGDLVEPSAGDPVLRVIDPHRLEVVASVPLADASRIVLGASARLGAAPLPSPSAALKVISRVAAVDSGSGTIPVRLAFTGAPVFPSGTPLDIDIDAEQHSNAVLVPSTAIVRDGEETAVFVASGTRAQRRVVRTGLTDATQVELLSGIAAGDRVIVDGQAGLPDGAAITIAGEGAR